jgi:hypothetical protein
VPNLLIAHEELRRRVESLPDEIAGWRALPATMPHMEAHHSQLAALDGLMTSFIKRQRTLLGELDPLGPAQAFAGKAHELVQKLVRSQQVWDFFRDKLEQRFSPTFGEPLWVADTVAWDCYRPVVENAADAGIIARAKLREPPLTCLTAALSPATSARGQRFQSVDPEEGTVRLPIPVIELPWDHAGNVWEFTSIAHEVGHDLEADFRLRDVIKLKLQEVLSRGGVAQGRIDDWSAWVGEVFADLVALQLVGPAFAETLMNILMMPTEMIVAVNQGAAHPTPYVRILMNAAYVERMAAKMTPAPATLSAHAREIRQLWLDFHGSRPEFDGHVADFPLVFEAMMDTPTQTLKGRTVRELIPFTAGDDARIRAAAQYLLSGKDAPTTGSLKPRHCVSAARLAVTQAARVMEEGGPAGEEAAARLARVRAGLGERLAEVTRLAAELVRQNATPGLRGDGPGSAGHRAYVASFVDII